MVFHAELENEAQTSPNMVKNMIFIKHPIFLKNLIFIRKLFVTRFGMVWASNSSSARKTITTYRVKVENSKIRKNDPLGLPGPPGLGWGWPHKPPLGPMGPHGSFMVAQLFNDEAAKSRYGAQWAPQGSPKGRARQGAFTYGRGGVRGGP